MWLIWCWLGAKIKIKFFFKAHLKASRHNLQTKKKNSQQIKEILSYHHIYPEKSKMIGIFKNFFLI